MKTPGVGAGPFPWASPGPGRPTRAAPAVPRLRRWEEAELGSGQAWVSGGNGAALPRGWGVGSVPARLPGQSPHAIRSAGPCKNILLGRLQKGGGPWPGQEQGPSLLNKHGETHGDPEPGPGLAPSRAHLASCGHVVLAHCRGHGDDGGDSHLLSVGGASAGIPLGPRLAGTLGKSSLGSFMSPPNGSPPSVCSVLARAGS